MIVAGAPRPLNGVRSGENMASDTRDVVNALLLELVRSPSHRLSLRGDHAHPLLLQRLRELAGMPLGANAGTIDVTINNRPWEIAVAITAGLAGDEAELSGRARKAT